MAASVSLFSSGIFQPFNPATVLDCHRYRRKSWRWNVRQNNQATTYEWPLMLVGANARVDLTPCGWQQINFTPP